MTGRRDVLKTVLLAAVALQTTPLLVAGPAAAAPGQLAAQTFIIVNGWVLTKADLARIDARAV